MPIYVYRCPECGVEEETLLPMGAESSKTHCNSIMQKVIAIPQPPIMKQTANDMALNSLNSKGTGHIKPQYKKLAARGLEQPEKIFY